MPTLRSVRVKLPISQLEKLWIHATRERTTVEQLIVRAVAADVKRAEAGIERARRRRR